MPIRFSRPWYRELATIKKKRLTKSVKTSSSPFPPLEGPPVFHFQLDVLHFSCSCLFFAFSLPGLLPLGEKVLGERTRGGRWLFGFSCVLSFVSLEFYETNKQIKY